MSAWIYIRSQPDLWTVGFYDSRGAWKPASDHNSEEEAAERVSYLNGVSNMRSLEQRIEKLEDAIRRLTILGAASTVEAA